MLKIRRGNRDNFHFFPNKTYHVTPPGMSQDVSNKVTPPGTSQDGSNKGPQHAFF